MKTTTKSVTEFLNHVADRSNQRPRQYATTLEKALAAGLVERRETRDASGAVVEVSLALTTAGLAISRAPHVDTYREERAAYSAAERAREDAEERAQEEAAVRARARHQEQMAAFIARAQALGIEC